MANERSDRTDAERMAWCASHKSSIMFDYSALAHGFYVTVEDGSSDVDDDSAEILREISAPHLAIECWREAVDRLMDRESTDE